MLPLASYFEKRGYDTLNILYPSRERNLEDLRDFVDAQISQGGGLDKNTTLHFVTHSMGGLICRYYIAKKRPKNLGRVVMLSPPNTGSEFADFFSEAQIFAPMFKAVFGPASAQLKTDYQHIEHDIDYPLGIIAGSASVNPLSPWFLQGENDGIVTVERTKIEGMSDHIVLPVTHSFMMFNPSVMEQAYSFIEDGKFKKDKNKKS